VSLEGRTAALVLVASLAFWPWFSNAAVAPRWAVLSVGVPVLLWSVRPQLLSPAGVIGAAFLSWAALSLAWTPVFWYGAGALWQWLLLAGLFVIGAELRTLRPVWIAAGLGMSVSGAIALAQLLGWQEVPSVNVPAGLFANRNVMAEAAGLVCVGLVAHRLWWLLPGTGLALALPLCRGAVLGVALAGIAWLWSRARVAAILLVPILVLGVAFSASGRWHSVRERLDIWHDAFAGMTWAGNGVGSFYVQFPAEARRHDMVNGRPTQAHSEPIELLFDHGPGALLLFGLVILALRGRDDAARYVLIAGLGMALVGFPLRMPLTAALLALVAGRLCRGGADLRVADPVGRTLAHGRALA